MRSVWHLHVGFNPRKHYEGAGIFTSPERTLLEDHLELLNPESCFAEVYHWIATILGKVMDQVIEYIDHDRQLRKDEVN